MKIMENFFRARQKLKVLRTTPRKFGGTTKAAKGRKS